jgi:hypothetical protein
MCGCRVRALLSHGKSTSEHSYILYIVYIHVYSQLGLGAVVKVGV